MYKFGWYFFFSLSFPFEKNEAFYYSTFKTLVEPILYICVSKYTDHTKAFTISVITWWNFNITVTQILSSHCTSRISLSSISIILRQKVYISLLSTYKHMHSVIIVIHRKWNLWWEFKSCLRLLMFHFVLMPLRKTCIHLFFSSLNYV